MAPKPKSASNNSSSENSFDSKKAAKQAAFHKAFAVDNMDKVHNFGRAIILGTGLIRAVGLGIEAAAGRAGASAAEDALAKSNPSTSRTMQVPKGTNVITSNNSGVANATSGVDRVIIQKSAERSAAGVQSYASSQGRIASAASLEKSAANIKNAAILAKLAKGSYDAGRNKPKGK